MRAKTAAVILIGTMIGAGPAMAQTGKPASPGDSGFFYTDQPSQAMLQYIPPGAKLPAFQMFCPKGTGKIAFNEIAGAPADGPITWASAGKSLVMTAKKGVTAKGTPYAQAPITTAEPAVLGLRDTSRVEITAPGAHYVAQATEGDRGEVGIFYTECDEGDAL